jgi:hypothetical protein
VEFLLMLFLDSGLNKTDGVHVMELGRYESYDECVGQMMNVQGAITDGKMTAIKDFAVRTAGVEYIHICMPIPKQ